MSSKPGLTERFWTKVQLPADINDCWEWTAAKNPSGHGRIGVTKRPKYQAPAHRLSYEWLIGPIPEGMHIDHLCENPSCVNPYHLEPVTLWENLRRCSRTPAVINAAKTHCLRGHEFTPENTRMYRNARACRTCTRLNAAKRAV